jgi:hypothetical protein
MRIDMKRSAIGTIGLGMMLLACSPLAGCSSATTSADSGFAGDPANAGAARPGGAEATAPGTSGAPSPGTSGSTDGPSPGASQQAGQLTAGVWDDNLNFDFYGQFLAKSQGKPSASIFSKTERDAGFERAKVRSAKTELDVAIVLDTTSSMGDEIKYLQAEFEAIATTIQAKFPQTAPRFGLVVYRDHSDEYLTRAVPFTSDVSAFKASLAQQSAAGGGDIPEAVPEGLTEGVNLGWRTTDDVARVMFWVADAPQHLGEEQKVNVAVTAAVQKGIHVYPVASSGVDDSAELAMRGAAQITGGRYIFLTNDSGIGSSHAEPHIPCYLVTPLQGAMVRMVESEMRGVRAEPAPNEVLRTVGSPVDGKCTLQDKSNVVLY